LPGGTTPASPSQSCTWRSMCVRVAMALFANTMGRMNAQRDSPTHAS
jgi:hypothetical protein